MQRGGGPGEGTDGLDPQRAREARRRGKHRRTAEAAETSAAPGPARTPDARDTPEDRDLHDEPGRRDDADRAEGRSRKEGRDRPERTAGAADADPDGTPKGGRGMGVTYKYFGAPDGATAARVPVTMRPEELGGDELGMGGMFTKIKPETMAAMVLTGIEGIPLHKVPPLELVVLHPDYAVVKLPMTVVDPLRDVGEESVGAAAFIWSTVPDRGGPRDAFNVYQLLHEWQDFSHRLHENGHQAYCLVWP